METAKKILTHLSESGHRKTKVRELTLGLLEKSKSPLSAAEIIELLKKKGKAVNKTTVYRELDFLLDKKIIRELDLLEGMKRYELVAEGGHHHHLICTKCKAIRCFDMHNDLDAVEKDIRQQTKFKVLSHTLEFFGLCVRCQ